MKKREIGLLIACILMFLQSTPTFASAANPEVLSESAILIDAKTGQVLFGKNENKRMHPASITKIATAIYAIENGRLDDQVVISENATRVEGTTVYLEAGEIVTLGQLIIGMFVNSGNDAAVAIAEHIDGTVENFAESINQYFNEEIGITNTRFENPHGLHGGNHYTTAADMAKITRYAMRNNDFRYIYKMKEYEWDGQSWDTTIVSHHRLLLGEFPYEAEITGGKNGFITESGFTLVTSAKNNDLELIVVTMKTDDKNRPYKDTIQLLDYGFENFQPSYIPSGSSFYSGNDEFIAKDDLFYIKNRIESYTNDVDSNGVLMISDSYEKTVVEFQLQLKNKVKQNIEKRHTSESDSAMVPVMKSSFANVVILIIIAAIVGVLIFNKRRQKE